MVVVVEWSGGGIRMMMGLTSEIGVEKTICIVV